MALTKEEFIEEIKSMSVLDLADIVKAIEEEFGVSAAPVAVAAVGGGVPAAQEAAEEVQEEFDVSLQEVVGNKITVIKVVRELTPLGLREAKDLVESAPTVVLEQVTQEAANDAKEKLEAAGAVVNLV